jgi:diphthine synthase
MTLYIIGIGLCDEKDISLKGLEAVKKCDKVFLESYTSLLQCEVGDLEKQYGKKIILADRDMVEKKSDSILEAGKNVAFLVIGDALSATTHVDLMQRAKEKGIDVEVIFNASVLTAVSLTGLQLYKFGKTGSIPYPEKGFEPETPYNILKENKDMHTLLLLDLRPGEKRFMTVSEAIEYLLKIEKKKGEKLFMEETFCVGCARLGCKDYVVKAGTAKELLKQDFGKAPHCLIVPGKMHFVEEEMIQQWKI